MKKYAFGVDIGGTTVKMGFFSTTGELKEMWEIPTRTEENGKYILGDIAAEVKKKMDELKISPEETAGIGVGVPGPIGPDGTVLKCVNLGWGIFNVEKELSKMTGLKVKAGNDANVAALGEMWQGGGRGFKDMVMVTLGTGVGGGIIIDGHILPGINGAAGEIGHIPMKEGETETCGCGKKGCLEQYASASGIARTAKKRLAEEKDTDSVLRNIADVTSKDIFDAAKEGDAFALSLVDEVGKMLGKALASIACVVNPEAFVIGGGMSKAGDILIDAIRKYYVEYAFHAERETEFKLAELGNNAGMFGGVKLVLD
ncbi:ROK family glucokinase [Mediterraneibacter glycyrrhizinilyticus]|nr:ROK family glucokinase [Mediterraneibacter glycyrrhizinilyticus]MBM6852855.1 ROK family glucokinase [Mediterraneibacter glycyrrhizinilyticus]